MRVTQILLPAVLAWALATAGIGQGANTDQHGKAQHVVVLVWDIANKEYRPDINPVDEGNGIDKK